MTRDYWNHNTAYHPWLVDIAARLRGDVLDVGCGDGLLLQRLAPVSRSVTGIEPDPTTITRAEQRLAGTATLIRTTFDDYDPGGQRFDLITFVASLHHMDLRAALTKARSMLRPTGEIAVVGLAANNSVRDWLWAGACLPVVRIASRLHGETRDIGVPVAEPTLGLDEIRREVAGVLPGSQIRRGLYYRFLLHWGAGWLDSTA
ncbi:class I SAM-dependent methyltransferase [Mycolicibacterium phlei]